MQQRLQHGRDVATARRLELDALLGHAAQVLHEAFVAKVVRKGVDPFGEQAHKVGGEAARRLDGWWWWCRGGGGGVGGVACFGGRRGLGLRWRWRWWRHLEAELLLGVAQCADAFEQLMGSQEEPGAEQEGEQIGFVGIVVGGGHHVLDERVERGGDEDAVAVDQRLCGCGEREAK